MLPSLELDQLDCVLLVTSAEAVIYLTLKYLKGLVRLVWHLDLVNDEGDSFETLNRR